MMNRNNENLTVTIARQIIAAIAALFLLSLFSLLGALWRKIPAPLTWTTGMARP